MITVRSVILAERTVFLVWQGLWAGWIWNRYCALGIWASCNVTIFGIFQSFSDWTSYEILRMLPCCKKPGVLSTQADLQRVPPPLRRNDYQNYSVTILFCKCPSLEAQQRYFSYCAIPLAIVSQNKFCVYFCGVSHNSRTICCKFKTGYRTDVPVWAQVARGGVSYHFGELPTSLKKHRTI